MGCKAAAIASAFALCATGAAAQTKTYLVHFDGSCEGMTLHVTNGLNILGDSVGCGETKKAYTGKMGPGEVANMTSDADPSSLVTLNYKIDMRDHKWVLYGTFGGETQEIGNGFWTKRGPTVTVNDVPPK